ncbi:MAG: hypothetical protein DDT21_02650 [Syntrophomonadaceae bacterium]|nr:hypothetical protein [Bacillota bacterium]
MLDKKQPKKQPAYNVSGFVAPKKVYKLGKLRSITYESAGNVYIHEFKNSGLPFLVYTIDGKSLHIIGGKYAVKNHEII